MSVFETWLNPAERVGAASWRSFLAHPPGGALTWTLFFSLLAIDATLMLGHIGGLAAQAAGWVAEVPAWLSTFGDTSPAERVNHLKWVAVIGCLVLVWRRTKAPVFLALAIVFAIVLADDALQLHERFGPKIRGKFGLSGTIAGIKASQFAEMVVWAALACIILPLLVLGYRRSSHRWRVAAIFPILGFSAAVFAGVGLDTVQEGVRLIADQTVAAALLLSLQLAECFGESAAASLTAAFSFGLWRAYAKDPV